MDIPRGCEMWPRPLSQAVSEYGFASRVLILTSMLLTPHYLPFVENFPRVCVCVCICLPNTLSHGTTC